MWKVSSGGAQFIGTAAKNTSKRCYREVAVPCQDLHPHNLGSASFSSSRGFCRSGIQTTDFRYLSFSPIYFCMQAVLSENPLGCLSVRFGVVGGKRERLLYHCNADVFNLFPATNTLCLGLIPSLSPADMTLPWILPTDMHSLLASILYRCRILSGKLAMAKLPVTSS